MFKLLKKYFALKYEIKYLCYGKAGNDKNNNFINDLKET